MAAADEELMLACAGGDAAAFEALYGRHKGALHRFVLHHEGGPGIAEIAAATGSGEEAAKSRLRHAMSKLREAIGDD